MEEGGWHKWLLLAVWRPSKKILPPTQAQAEFSLGKVWGHPQSVCWGQGVRATIKLRLEEGPQEVSSPTSCSKRGQLWGQMRFLRALFSWVLQNSKDGGCHDISGLFLLK